MSRTEEELAVAFKFLIDSREMKEWLPALVTAAGDDNRWDFFRAVCDAQKVCIWYAPDPSTIHEQIENRGDETCSASDELIFTKLCAIEMPDIWYDAAYDAIGDLIDELRKEGHVHPAWRGERGSDIVKMAKWFGESEWMSEQ